MDSVQKMLEAKLGNRSLVIYGFGVTGKWLAGNFRTTYFVDTDIKKEGSHFLGVPVLRPQILTNLDSNKYLVVVTVVDLFDVVSILNHLQCEWTSLYHFLDGGPLDSLGINTTGETDGFVRYSLDTVLECQRMHYDPTKFYLRSVDVVITEKCSLRCIDCANLMQFYDKPKNFELIDIVAGVINLASKVDWISELRIIGGEPFMNKEIYTVIKQLSEIPNVGRCVIYTNGMIVPKDTELRSLSKDRVLFSITDYGELGRNLSKTITVLSEGGFNFRVHPPEHWTDSGRILDEELTKDQATELFAKCCGKNLFTLIADRLYRCPFAANADQLAAIPSDSANLVRVTEERDSIKSYTYGLSYIEACRRCPGRSFDAPIIQPAKQSKQPLSYKKWSVLLE